MWRAFATVFATVFLAEIGDKTQLATMLFAADQRVSPLVVFAASALALTLAAGVGVLVGTQLERFIAPSTLKRVARLAFIAIGVWTLVAN